MDASLNASGSGPAGWDVRLVVRRFLVAVILGEAIWSLLVSITNNLVVPALARVMGGDVQSPLYLGKGDFNIPALLISVLQACLAGIVAVLVNSWPQRSGRSRSKVIRATPATAPVVVATPSIVTPPPANTAVRNEEPLVETPPTPKPVTPAAQPTSPAKPKKAKKVYYNIVGEPVEDDE